MKKRVVVLGISLMLLTVGLTGCEEKTYVNIVPVADFNYSLENLTVTFVDNSTDPDGEIISWFWDFGDNETSTERNPLHIFQEDGTYTINLTVKDDNGEMDICSVIIAVEQSTINYDDYCFYPFCDLTPTVYDLIGSNEPSDYLGDRISYESHSNWKNYTPLVQRVEEIIAGKDTEYDKFMAIARYVRNCREYGLPSPANEFKSVIDIYESSSGVCLDASILCTAMLRIAGISARSMISDIFHEFNEVYVNNTWITFDATFGDGEPSIIDFSLSSPYFPSQVHDYLGTYYNVTHYITGFYKKVNLYRQMFCSNDLLKSEYGEGIIIYPVVSSRPIYYNSTLMNASQGTAMLLLSLDKQGEYQDETWFERSAFEVKNSSIEHLSGSSFSYVRSPGTDEAQMNTARYIGYYKTLAPALKYRLNYRTQVIQHHVAYVDFEVKDGQTTIITPDDIKKASGESQNNFEVFMSVINELPSYEELL